MDCGRSPSRSVPPIVLKSVCLSLACVLKCKGEGADLDAVSACGLALQQRFGFPDATCPEESPLAETDAAALPPASPPVETQPGEAENGQAQTGQSHGDQAQTGEAQNAAARKKMYQKKK